MSQVACPKCRKVLDYSGDPPRYCAYCGQALGASSEFDPRLLATASLDSGMSPGSMATLFGPASDVDQGRGRGVEADPEQIERYTIVRLLGRGGMGSVYEAEDVELGRRVALKLIAADHVSSSEAVERFRQEGRLASTLAHPRCVFVLSADEYRGRPYIVMELMPGQTLQTLVETSGSLPIVDAVTKVLDVIDGLREAHHQGIIHRDVKPSNCFLESNGRVKVGDFGLSKSLENDAGLTRTGSFIGTPLYASPEQIKRAEIDARTDVYSVAATLYYLLTGRPPFQAGDAAAVLAKIVSEPPTPLRSLRPELPAALGAAVMRGLERDRDRRWQDLGRLREALQPFVPVELTISDLVLRAGAFMGDVGLLFAVESLVIWGLSAVGGPSDARRLGTLTPWLIVGQRLLFLAYFTTTEGIWGASLGKRLAGMRVGLVPGGGPPGMRRAFVRALICYALTTMPGDGVTALLFGVLPSRQAVLSQPLAQVVRLAGYLVMATTMKAGNGFRGLHERVSGTRVVRSSRRPRRRVTAPRRLPDRPDHAREMTGAPVGVLKSVGPFRVRGAVRWEDDRRVLLGEDSTLERPVWLVVRPKGSPPPPPERRDLTRPSRPRWLAGGEQAEGRWDAFAAPSGCPLADFAGLDGLPWADARPILHDLADELNRALADGTLPRRFAVDQVWVQANGAVLLADPLGSTTPAAADPAADRQRALNLVRQAATLALQGGRYRPPNSRATPSSIRAVVPVHAARMLDRLVGCPRRGDLPYDDPAALIADLEADRDKPTEVDRVRRLVHLAPTAAALGFPLGLAFAITFPGSLSGIFMLTRLIEDLHLSSDVGVASRFIAVLAGCWMIWALLTRGGLLLGLAGVALVRSDSRPAERWRCGFRCLVAWALPAGLLLVSCATRSNPSPTISWFCWIAALAVVLTFPVLALWNPSRGLHDRLAGTHLVPE